MRNPLIALARAGALLAAALAALPAQAAYPDKPVQIIIPYPAGGAGDRSLRVIADKLTETMSQQMVVVNNPGGSNGTVGTERVARSAPDGYNLLYVETAVFTINPHLYKNLNYRLEDFAPITLGVNAGFMIVANGNVPIDNMRQLEAWARTNKAIPFGIAGLGSIYHLALIQLKETTGLDLLVVPYQGTPAILADLLGGRLTLAFGQYSSAAQHVQSGRARFVGASTTVRSPLAPNLPTLQEQGVKDYDFSLRYGFFAPARTPREIVNRLQGEINKAVHAPDLQAKFRELDMNAGGNTPEAFSADLRRQTEQFGRLVRAGNVKIE